MKYISVFVYLVTSSVHDYLFYEDIIKNKGHRISMAFTVKIIIDSKFKLK